MTRQTIKVKVKVELEGEMEVNAEDLFYMSIEEYVDAKFDHYWDITDYIQAEVV